MKSWWNKYKFFVLGIWAIAAFVGLYGYREYNRGLPDTHSLKSAFTINASEFAKQFEADESKATSQYADKTISVEGIVASVYTTDSSASVLLNDEGSMASVMCQFVATDVPEIKKLNRGDIVTIKGICSGYLMDVVLERCVIEK
jgi:hypothetical protein